MPLLIKKNKSDSETRFLDGHFLIAMPQVTGQYFVRSVIYVCSHSSTGAMGFIINRPQENFSFVEVILNLNIPEYGNMSSILKNSEDLPILSGGPLEMSCGFVLHSSDYVSDSSISISENISLTITVDIMKAISQGKGPKRSAIMFGYTAWMAGQLESEIHQNGWLTCPAVEDLIFDMKFDEKYERSMAILGVNTSMLSSQVGHA
nr:YqgE/AlgH family protein [Candidatus Liberibacter sp.]